MKLYNNQQRLISTKINHILCAILFTVALSFSESSLANNDFDESLILDMGSINIREYQPYFSLGIGQNKHIGVGGFNVQQQGLTGSFRLGLIKTTTLTHDWVINKSVEINYATTNFSGHFQTDHNITFIDGLVDNRTERSVNIDGKYQEITLLGSVNVKKLHIFENIAPYMQASIGLINANNRFNSAFETQQDSAWKLGYRLSTGLEFDIGKGNSISFGVGFSDDTDI